MGKKEPKNPDKAIHFHWPLSIVLKVEYPASNKNTPVIMVLKAPNWYALKPNKDFLIRMKDVPHIKESTIRYNHFTFICFIET